MGLRAGEFVTTSTLAGYQRRHLRGLANRLKPLVQVGESGLSAAVIAATEQAREYETYLRALVDERPGERGASLALARYLSARGDLDQALLELKRLLDRDPDNLQVRIVLGQCLLASRREDEIVGEFGSLLELLERSPRLLQGEPLE